MRLQPDWQQHPNERCEAVVVLGASVRALAQSAGRAGLVVFAADLFGDRDLADACLKSRVVKDYPRELAVAASEFPQAPWIYSGAVEHHGDLIDAISRVRPLAGCDRQAVRVVRDPRWLGQTCRDSGLAYPATSATPDGIPLDGSFLVKPRAGAGGRGIAPWTVQEAARDRSPGEWLWQRRLQGISKSVVILAGPSTPIIVGTSEQFVGLEASRGPAFGWCGGVELRGLANDVFMRFAQHLVASGCRGLLGVDYLEDANGTCHVVEVNPRPTASMELFERSWGISLVAAHLHACGFSTPRSSTSWHLPPSPVEGPFWAKGVLFARDEILIAAADIDAVDRLDRSWRATSFGWPSLADVPHAGARIPARSPILTVFAAGDDPPSCRAEVERRLQHVERILMAERAPAESKAHSEDASAGNQDGFTVADHLHTSSQRRENASVEP